MATLPSTRTRATTPPLDEGPRKRRRTYAEPVAFPTPSSSSGPTLMATSATPTPQPSPGGTASALPDLPPSPASATPATESSSSRDTWAEQAAVLSAGQIQILSTRELSDDRLGAYDGVRGAIDTTVRGVGDRREPGTSAGEPFNPGRLRRALLALGSEIASERNYRIGRDALAALGLAMPETEATIALGLHRNILAHGEDTLRDICVNGPRGLSIGMFRHDAERGDGALRSPPREVATETPNMCFPFFFVQDASAAAAKTSLLVAMRASLAVLGSLVEHAHVARTRMWLRGRAGLRPAEPARDGHTVHCAFGLLLREQAAEVWVMHHPLGTRTPYFVARAWAGQVGTPEFAGVFANILATRERAELVRECVDIIVEGRRGPRLLTPEDEIGWGQHQAFVAWARENIGDAPRARLFEQGLRDAESADGYARVAAWVAAHRVR